MTTNDNDCLAKTSNNFECKICNYISCRKYNFNLHMNSKKHKDNYNNPNNSFLVKKYICDICGKIHNDRAGLWRHKKKCITKEQENNNENILLEIVKSNQELQKSNQELKQQILDICKNFQPKYK